MGRRGQFPKWPLAGANWTTKCTNRIMAPHSNCQLPIAIGSAETINRSFDRCFAAFSSAPFSLPCSALGHVLQTFCCRLLKVISLLRAAFLSLPPLHRLHLVSLAPRRCIFFARLHVLQEGCRTPSLLGGPANRGEGRGLYLLQHLWLFVCHIICTNCNLEK